MIASGRQVWACLSWLGLESPRVEADLVVALLLLPPGGVVVRRARARARPRPARRRARGY